MSGEVSRQDDTAARLRMILNSARDGIIALDPQGCIDGVNPAIEGMFGYSEQELNGKGISVLYEETPTLQQVTSFLYYIRSKAGETSSSLFRGKRKNGTTLLCEVAVTPMQLSSGTNYVAIVRDITERARVEEIKDQFVATVSHELRTPLTSISGSLGLLAGGAAGELPPNALKLVKIAHSNSERLVRLINDILDIEKIESGKMAFNIRLVPLRPLIVQSLEGIAGFAEQYSIELDLAPGFEQAAVEADPDRILQVLTNLLSNAIKFSPTGETVRINIEQAEKNYRVNVTNSGEGIPDEFRERIFSRFAQADGSSARQEGGTGLGLNIVKEIVTKLGGNVAFESSPGEGATFSFTLPAATAKKVEVLVCTPVGGFISDATQLFELNVSLWFAETVDVARQLLSSHSFSAAILDLRLSGEFRCEVVQAIQNQADHCPLIVFAGDPLSKGGALPLEALLEMLERPAPDPIDADVSRIDQPAGGRILHIEDDEDILSLVKGAFGSETEVVAARTLEEGQRELRRHKLDAVILDLQLGSECGLGLLPIIRLIQPAVPVVIFSASDAEANVKWDAEAVLTKSKVSLNEVVSTVRSLISGG